jgi:hypothetical protein
MAKRIALSHAQAESGVAAELVSLLQSITSDGHISNSEIKSLYDWIRTHDDGTLPGIALLKMTIEAIAADGKVTEAEREELAKTIEKVLPPDLRELAKQRRRLRVLANRERDRALESDRAAEAQRELAKTEPEHHLDFLVAGVSYEGRAAITSRMAEGEAVFLIRDRSNVHSRNAIEVRTQVGYQIGFVPERDAKALAPLLDKGYKHIALVRAIWEGRSVPVPIIDAEIFPPDTENRQAVAENQVPKKRSASAPMLIGFAVFAAVFLVVALSLLRSCN